MIDVATILGLLGQGAAGIKTATEIAHNLKKIVGSSEPDMIESKTLILELLDKLLDAKRDQMTVENLLADLQKELEKRDRFAQKAAHYEFSTTDMGGSVYTLKRGDNSGRLPNELCAQCFEKEKIGILQLSTEAVNTFLCQRCGSKILKSDGRDIGIRVSSTSPFRDPYS